jgi:hypothetical protein
MSFTDYCRAIAGAGIGLAFVISTLPPYVAPKPPTPIPPIVVEPVVATHPPQEAIEVVEVVAEVVPTATPTPTPHIPQSYAPPTNTASGGKYDWLRTAGIPETDWVDADFIISRESGWNPCSYNPGKSNCSLSSSQVNATQPKGAACGLAQSLPCGKQEVYGHWTDPIANLRWQYSYVRSRYGGYAQAVAFWRAHGWY